MKKILLAHSFFLRFDPKQWKAQQPYAPLGTLFAASYLRERGYPVVLFDAMLARGPRDLLPLLQHERPEVVIFHEDNFNWLSKMCLTKMREACFEMIGLVRETLGSNVPVVVAGSDATDHRELYFQHGADYAVIGESELTLAEFLQVHDAGKKEAARVSGLAHKNSSDTDQIPTRGFVKNLDMLPQPAWDLIDTNAYRQTWRRKHGYYSINLVTTRGCPFRCNWCAKPIYGNRYNSRSPQNVVQEMLWLERHLAPDHIWFADDIFGLKPGWVQRFAELVREADVVTPFKIQARVDLLDDEVVAALKQAGCRTIWVGAESGSQKILDAMDKGTTVEQIYEAARRVKRAGMQICFFLQFGYPGETERDIEQTRRMVRECDPDDIGISVSYPLPGTKFYERVKSVLGEKQNWEHSDDLDLMFPGYYRPEFYRQLHRVVHQEFRLRKAVGMITNAHGRRDGWAGWRQAAAALGRAPLLLWERAKLQRLKQPNR